MKNFLLEEIKKYIKENNMIEYGDKIIVAVSGGADSLCLLDVLNNLSPFFCSKLYVAHINHNLRGDDSDRDEQHVKKICKDYGLDFFSKSVDVNKVSKDKKESIELSARNVRYEFFNELKDKLKADKIALAHNGNDQGETFLIRLFRGSGIEGLKSMEPVRDGIFIRPLLNTTRKEIEKYCTLNNIVFRDDMTNFQNIYVRNKIRLDLIPYIENNFNINIVNTLINTCKLLNEDSKALLNISKIKYNKYVFYENNKIKIVKDAFIEESAIVKRIIRFSIEELIGNKLNIESVHIDQIIALQGGNTGNKTKITNNLVCENVYGNIIILKDNNIEETLSDKEVFLKLEDFNFEKILRFNQYKIKIRLSSYEDYLKNKNNVYTKFFHYDKIRNDILIRYRKDGDDFNPFGMKGRKKISDLFMDLKLPREIRNKIPLILFDNEIAWVVGYRTSELFKIKNSNDKILEIVVEDDSNEK